MCKVPKENTKMKNETWKMLGKRLEQVYVTHAYKNNNNNTVAGKTLTVTTTILAWRESEWEPN